MLNLINKEKLTIEEILKLDSYLCDHLAEVVSLKNDQILKAKKIIYDCLDVCLFEDQLYYYLQSEAIKIEYHLEEEKIGLYHRYIELCKLLDFELFDFQFILGDYYYKNNPELALKYYQDVFKEGFNLCSSNYFYRLKRYINLINENPTELLERLIKTSPKLKDKYTLDFIDTYILLIIKLDKNDEKYIKLINEAIELATIVVRTYQKKRDSQSYSNTNEERDLCELWTLKMIHHIQKHEYQEATKAYHQLSNEIHMSNCTNYYHAREKYYYEMLELMAKDYDNLSFLKDFQDDEWEILNELNEPKDILKYVHQEIDLKNKRGEIFKGLVESVSEIYNYVIDIKLPQIDQCGHIYLELIKDDNRHYLQIR